MITRILENSRFLSALVVMTSIIASVTLQLYTLITACMTVIAYVSAPSDVGGSLALKFIKLVDVALLATVFQLIAIGIYKLFIDSSLTLPEWLKVENLDDLKNKLVRVMVLVMAVSFLTEVIEGDPGPDVAYLGVGTAAVIAALTYFAGSNSR